MKKRESEPCDFCDGELAPRSVRVVRTRARKMIIIDGVPAMVCSRCGMRYFDAVVVRSMEAILKKDRPAKRLLRVPVAKFEVVA